MGERKTSGSAKIWGFDIEQNPRNARNSIGVVPQELFIDPFFTPFETLEMQAGLYGVPKKDRRTNEILRLVKLEDKAKVYSRTLSGGMKRRLLVAKAMVHSPPILVLDEPTAGVDIELRRQLWQNIRRMHAAGTTIVLTTHYLEEAEKLCETIAIINHGRVVVCEPTEKLVARIDEKEIIFDLETPLSETPGPLKKYHLYFERPDRMVIQVNKSKTTVGEILESVRQAGLKIRDLSTSETDLEDIFLQLTQTDAGEVQATSGNKVDD